MSKYSFFISVICPVKESAHLLESALHSLGEYLSERVEDYEILVIDNGSIDSTAKVLNNLTQTAGEPNLQVFMLTKEVDFDTAAWVGLANSLGDFAIVYNHEKDDINLIDKMIESASNGNDVVFARDQTKKKHPAFYALFYKFYNIALKSLAEIDLDKDVTSFRLLSKKVINYLLMYPNPVRQYRFLPATAGFSKETINYVSNHQFKEAKSVNSSIEKGISLLILTTRAPMRIVTALTLFGALINLLYSAYVLFIAFFKDNIAPGWVTLSLQQSGMFFLFSVVFFMLGEYILHMSNISSEGPGYHVAQEMTSSVIRHREKLNIEEQKNVRPS